MSVRDGLVSTQQNQGHITPDGPSYPEKARKPAVRKQGENKGILSGFPAVKLSMLTLPRARLGRYGPNKQ